MTNALNTTAAITAWAAERIAEGASPSTFGDIVAQERSESAQPEALMDAALLARWDSLTEGLTVETVNMGPTVADASGQRWFPSNGAEMAIYASDLPLEEAILLMVLNEPSRGTWYQ